MSTATSGAKHVLYLLYFGVVKMDEMEKVTCVACKEVIQQGAMICPHCGKHQTRSNLHLLVTGLKWAAGVTALLPLIISAS